MKNRRNPTLLYGHGSFGISMDARFVAIRFGLIDRGFEYATGHFRGDSALGRSWYEDSKMRSKRNTFIDLIACRAHLIKQGCCR